MEVTQDFVLPPLAQEKPTVSDKVASEKAFYAAGSYSEDPINDYQTIKSDLIATGESLDLSAAELRWKNEQDEDAKEYFTKLLEDPSVDVNKKKSALAMYATSGYLSKSLRDKYTENIAGVAPGPRVTDNKAQDELVKALSVKQTLSEIEALEEDTEKALGPAGVKQYAEGTFSALGDIAKSIPASLWGAVQGIWDRDLITGQEVTEELMNNWSSNPSDPRSLEIKNKIFKSLEFLEAPYRRGFESTLATTDSEQAAIAAGLATEAVVGGFLGSGLRVLTTKARTKLKGTPKLKSGTPLDTTINANPKMGADLAAGIIKDTDGDLGAALGEDAGTIVANMVFPKALGKELEKHSPSIHKRLSEDIAELDKKVIADIESTRWDPSIQTKVSERQADYALILKTKKEVSGGAYMPSMSSLSPTPTKVYEGKAVFGKDEDLFFDSRESVINAFNNIKNTVAGLPEELKSEVVIRDRLTGEQFTPESLMANPNYKTGLELLGSIPAISDNGVPVVKTDLSGKTNYRGKPLIAQLTYTADGLPDKIEIDSDAINAKFEDGSLERNFPGISKRYKTPQEFLRFVLTHEDTHSKVSRPSFVSEKDHERLVNELSFETFKGIKNAAFAKESAPKQFTVEWNWAKEYDDMDLIVFGEDAVKTKLVGVDASGLARSSLSQWIFGGGGIFPRWFEQSGARAAPREAKISSNLIKTIQKKIAGTKFPNELNQLITDAESAGREYYSINAIQDMFPKLSKADVETLYETHTYWRRVNHYTHALLNIQKRNELVKDGFTKGLYIEGKYNGAVNGDINFNDLSRPVPKQVWDFEKEFPINFTRDVNSVNEVFDVGGKKLVQLSNPYTHTDGKVFDYTLVNDTKATIDVLPEQVVPRRPGYSPIKTKASWYIDIIPKQLEVNGFLITDAATLRKYKRTVAAADTELEIKKLEEEFKAKYTGAVSTDDIDMSAPTDYEVVSRLDREINFERILTDNEAHGELLRHSMQRGERLSTVNGEKAPIEDRLVSLVNSVRTVSRKGSMQQYDTAVENAFMQTYGRFVPSKQFPTTVKDIAALPQMSKAEAIEYKNAVSVFEQYAKIKSFGTFGDRKWADITNGIADILEKYKLTSKLAPKARDLGKEGNLVVEIPRKVASTLYISLNPLRQWLVQPAQLLEMYAINPQTAVQRLADLGAVRIALASRGDLLNKERSVWYEAAAKASLMDRAEFDKTIMALEKSGLLESVDLNMMVHGVFKDADRALIEGPWEASYNNIAAAPKAIVRGSRSVGFDFAELNNRIGLWMIAKDKWVSKNPDKDWGTPEAIEQISFDEWKLSGSMTKAGSFPYQSGALAVVMQFAAITQKLTMNLVQGNGVLTGAEKARLVAARSALWGAKYGVPGGALAYYLVDGLSTDEEDPNYEANKLIKENAEVLKRGIADRVLNNLLGALTGDDADLLVSRGMSPYGEYTSGIPYFDTYKEIVKMVDNQPGTNLRLPALSAVGTVFEMKDKMQSWFTVKELTGDNEYKQAIYEAAYVASGMNNFMKSLLMVTTKEKLTKNGNKFGLDFTAAEAYAQALGVTTWREEDLFKGINASMDRKAMLETAATEIHQWMINIETKSDKEFRPVDRFDMLTSFTTMLVDEKNFTQQDAIETYALVVEKMSRKDKNMSTSLFESYLKSHTDKNSRELEIVKNSLKQFPSTKELIDTIENRGNP